MSKLLEKVSIEIRYLFRVAPLVVLMTGKIIFVANIPEVADVAPLGLVLSSSKLLHPVTHSINATPNAIILETVFIFILFLGIKK
jgi:hypothetical protein